MSSIEHHARCAQKTEIDELFKLLVFAFAERGYTIHMVVLPKSDGSVYCSTGVGLANQKRSILFAFGFYYIARHWELDGYCDYYAERCIEQYERFLNGEWPVDKIDLEEINAAIYDTPARVKQLAQRGKAQAKNNKQKSSQYPLFKVSGKPIPEVDPLS